MRLLFILFFCLLFGNAYSKAIVGGSFSSQGSEQPVVQLKQGTANVAADPLTAGAITLMERYQALYVGILVAIFFFNLSVYISSKDKTYLYYSIYIFALFFYVILYFRGYSNLFGEPLRDLINANPHVFLGIGTIAGITFSSSFLNLPEILPWSKRVLRLLIAVWVLTMITCIFGHRTAVCAFAEWLAIFSIMGVWLLGMVALYKGYQPAMYYVIAWASVCVSAVWLLLHADSGMPRSSISFHVVPLGFIFELFLLSLALGDRLRSLKKSKLEEQSDKLRVQEENLYLISTQNERLERVVESRTKALKKMVQSLEAANADKSRLFSIIAHDLRSPFNSLISLLSLNDMDLLTFEDVKLLLNDSRKNIDNIHNTLNNLLYWAQSQMGGITTAASVFSMRVLVDDLMLVYLPLITKKNIKVEFLVEDDEEVFADLDQISLVMRNLIDNALKFTPLERFMQIRITGNDTHLLIAIANPVSHAIDVNKLNGKQASTPTYGTSNERGVGLGLQLCKDFIERNKGDLTICKEGECVVLRFNLPKAV